MAASTTLNRTRSSGPVRSHPAHAYIRYERGVIQRLCGDLAGAKQSLTDAKQRLAQFDLAPAASWKEIDEELAQVEAALRQT